MQKFFENWADFLQETQKSVNITDFTPKDNLNTNIWKSSSQLKPEISEKLAKIARNFLEGVGLDSIVISDITFTGSLANYNWSDYSDIDLHIMVDYEQIDENTDLVREFFRGKIGIWNRMHDIRIFDHEVEIYVQDDKEKHVSSGVYSIMRDRWLITPFKKEIDLDWKSIEMKYSMLTRLIDDVEMLYGTSRYDEAYTFADKIKEKIRKFRKCGLEHGGEYSIENLAFKMLRRSGQLERLSNITIQSYDQMMSLSGDFARNWMDFANAE
tara:strand:+ start:359 stop:1165 length:807 start_codon:yes stop_codon:yes gene_type:complete